MQVSTSIGKGGTNGVLTAAQMTQLYQRLGSTNLELCFNPKLHGFSSSTMHSRCDNRGKTLTVMRRNSNGKVFGGYVHTNLDKSRGWYHGNWGAQNPWLFTVASGKVKFLPKKNQYHYAYYMNNGYAMTWGGGHDLYCSSGFTGCHANPHTYVQSTNELSGSRNWNHKDEAGSKGMVYEVYLIK